MWLCLYKFGMLKLLQPTSFLFTTTMHPIPSAQCSTIISLLHEPYSIYEIQSKTGIGKSTIGRIKKQVDINKETIRVVNLPSFPLMINNPFFAKSLLESLTMLFKLPILSTASFPILSQPKQSGMSSRRMGFPLLSRRSTFFLRGSIKIIVSNLPSTMKSGQ